ncbi:MAG: hypothetical protein ACPG7F_05795 [Aggregatilineales bacterium]
MNQHSTQFKGIPDHHYATVRRAVFGAIATSPAVMINPLFDTGVVTGNWTLMINNLALESRQDISPEVIEKLVYGVWLHMSSYAAGTILLKWLLALIPLTGLAAAIGVSGLTNAYLTYRFGKFLAYQMDEQALSADDAFIGNVGAWLLRPSWQDFRELLAIIRQPSQTDV